MRGAITNCLKDYVIWYYFLRGIKMSQSKPKLKSKRSAAKRFKVTAGGIKRSCANHNHILTKKDSKRKARLTKTELVNKCDEKNIARLLLVNVK